ELLLEGTGMAVQRVNERTFYLERRSGTERASRTLAADERIERHALPPSELAAMVVTGSRMRGVEPPGATVLQLNELDFSNSARPSVTDMLRMLPQDRKSTRLNSSHVKISYAVFCLKKKKKKQTNHITR